MKRYFLNEEYKAYWICLYDIKNYKMSTAKYLGEEKLIVFNFYIHVL